MKKLMTVLPAVFLLTTLYGCKTAPEPEDVVRTWIQAFEEREVEGIMDAYWDDAVFSFFADGAVQSRLEGKSAIEEMQRDFVENPDAVIDIDTAGLNSMKSGDSVVCEVIFRSGDAAIVNRLEMVERDGRWGILNQTAELQ